MGGGPPAEGSVSFLSFGEDGEVGGEVRAGVGKVEYFISADFSFAPTSVCEN